MKIEEEIREKLKEVVDPELGIDVVNLGFIYGIEVEDEKAKIEMTFTSPGCPMRGVVKKEIKNKVKELKEINEVELNVVFDPPWSLDRMSEKAKKKLGFKR